MNDTTGLVGGSDSHPGYLQLIRSNADVLLVLVALAALSYVTTSYGDAGLFPLVFLVSGTLFMLVELGSHFLPSPYRERVRDALTRRMAEIDLSEDGDESETETTRSARDVGLVIGMLAVFFAVTYTVNFLAGAIVFTLVTGYALGLRDYRLVVLAIVLAAIVYGVFGEIVNTPVLE